MLDASILSPNLLQLAQSKRRESLNSRGPVILDDVLVAIDKQLEEEVEEETKKNNSLNESLLHEFKIRGDDSIASSFDLLFRSKKRKRFTDA